MALELTFSTAAVGGTTFSYRYILEAGDQPFDQEITRSELEANNAWSFFIWPDPANSPDKIKPATEYTIQRAVPDTIVRDKLAAILRPRVVAARERPVYVRKLSWPL